MQIGDPEMKILNFPDDTTIFLLRDINYHTRMQSVLKSHEKDSTIIHKISEIKSSFHVKQHNTGKV